MRAAIKATLLVLHLAVGLGLAGIVALDQVLPGERPKLRERLAGWWSRRALAILKIKVVVTGSPADVARLTVANHVSWLDIPVLSGLELTRFISKAEVRDWPVAGWLAEAAGTFYIRRGKGGSGPLLKELVPHLSAGGSVTLFPEGTTTDGRTVGEFHSRLFGAAIDADSCVQPVALVYDVDRSGARIAPFIGDDDLLSHILRLLRSDGFHVSVTYFNPVAAGDRSREELAAECRDRIHARIRKACTMIDTVEPADEDGPQATVGARSAWVAEGYQ